MAQHVKFEYIIFTIFFRENKLKYSEPIRAREWSLRHLVRIRLAPLRLLDALDDDGQRKDDDDGLNKGPRREYLTINDN